MTTIDYDPEGTVIRLPSGRTLHVWHHDCEHCTSVDVWTEDGQPTHPLTDNGEKCWPTAAEQRAPFGMFAMAGGRRFKSGGVDAVPCTNTYPALTTAMLVWSDR